MLNLKAQFNAFFQIMISLASIYEMCLIVLWFTSELKGVFLYSHWNAAFTVYIVTDKLTGVSSKWKALA